MVKFWITSASEWDFMICLKAPWIFQYNPIKSPNVDFSMIIPWNLHILIQFSCFTSIRNPIKTSLNTIHIWIFHGFSIIFHENRMNAPCFTRWCCFPRPGAWWSAHRRGPAWPKCVGRGAGDAGRPHAFERGETRGEGRVKYGAFMGF